MVGSRVSQGGEGMYDDSHCRSSRIQMDPQLGHLSNLEVSLKPLGWKQSCLSGLYGLGSACRGVNMFEVASSKVASATGNQAESQAW